MKSFIMALCVFLSTISFAQSVKTFMPKNNLHEQDGLFDNGMTEQDFNDIIDQVQNYYGYVVNQYGATLQINRLWKNATVNAQAYQQGNTWMVDMFGGLARRPEITFDGFAMVVCHEVGHHLGGFPNNDWAANEGQSDYWAMLACAKNIWGNQSNKVDYVDPTAKKLCDQYVGQNNSLCYREMNAGISLANLLAALGGEYASITTPDKTKVSRTDGAHPKAQCRLDTYVAGTLCNAQWDDYVIPQSERESANYTCVSASSTSYDIKARPRCWFKPSF